MTNSEIILETLRWIEGRLREDLPVPAVAAKSGYSLYHFVRLFGAVVGVPPKEYILRRKLSEAGRDLARGKAKVTDIAFEYGFRDLETFSRAFVRSFGVTPLAVRRGAPFPYLDPMAAIMPATSPASGRQARVASFPSCLLAGYSVRVPGPGEGMGPLWARFAKRAPSIRRSLRPLSFRQLATWSEEAEDGLEILAGLEMETLDELDLDLVGKVIPACDCLVFEHRGPMEDIPGSYQAIYGDILPGMERMPTLAFNFERYPEKSSDASSPSLGFEICVPLAAPPA